MQTIGGQIVRVAEIYYHEYGGLERREWVYDNEDASKISDYLIEKGEFAVREPAEAAEPEPAKPSEPAATEDRYRYEEITFDDYSKLRQSGYDVDENCRRSAKHPDMVILRFRESQQAEVHAVLHQAIAAKK